MKHPAHPLITAVTLAFVGGKPVASITIQADPRDALRIAASIDSDGINVDAIRAMAKRLDKAEADELAAAERAAAMVGLTEADTHSMAEAMRAFVAPESANLRTSDEPTTGTDAPPVAVG